VVADALVEACEAGVDVVFDMARVSFIESLVLRTSYNGARVGTRESRHRALASCGSGPPGYSTCDVPV